MADVAADLLRQYGQDAEAIAMLRAAEAAASGDARAWDHAERVLAAVARLLAAAPRPPDAACN